MVLNILIVDDSPTLRDVIENYLKTVSLDMGIEVYCKHAGNGDEAEKEMQESHILDNPFDVVILDWMMPKVSGLEFLQRIRATSIFIELPDIIMLTAETYPDQIAHCMKYNVIAYLTKPFQINDLKDALTKVIQKRRFKYAV